MAFSKNVLLALVLATALISANAQASAVKDGNGVEVNSDGSITILFNGSPIYTSASGVASALPLTPGPLPDIGHLTAPVPGPKASEIQSILQGIIPVESIFASGRKMKL